MFFNTGYYAAMDREYVSGVDPEFPELETPIKAKEDNIDLGPKQIGVGTNPFVHPTQGVEARLHDGASKMEISFFGQGKGNKERFTPESIGKTEREEIRNLAKLNDVKISTHATVAVEGLAGFGKEGFDDQQRTAAIHEIEKAIDFAADASTGGAIVFHTGEWQRPISEQNFGTSKGGGFEGFSTEKEKAVLYTVDRVTGQLNGIKKDQNIYEPDFLTVKSFSEVEGYSQDSSGSYVDDDGNKKFTYVGKDEYGDKIYRDAKGDKIYEDEWVDKKGNFIDPDPTKTERWFQRVPKWNADNTNFDVKEMGFDDFKKQAEKFNRRHGFNVTPEELYVKSQTGNKVLQAKGSSLYHANRYEEHIFQRKKILDALKFYKKLDANLSKNEKYKLEKTREAFSNSEFDMLPTKESKVAYLKRSLKSVDDQMRHIHESSAAADAQAKQAEKSIERIETIEKYGIRKTADSIARLATKVWQKNQNKKDPGMDDLYLAPENFDPNKFGGHPREMTKIIEKSRETFIEQNRNILGAEKAKKVAEQTIKSTIDIGHLNQWRKNFQREPEENDKEFHKRFDTWVMKEVDKMHEKKVLGHFHLADNFGYDDEHLTPGEGNAPIKEFVKKLKEKGYDDFIVEAGSFNPTTTLQDSWSYFGTPVHSSHPRGSFRDFRQQHFQYKSTPLYIAGAYAPSNQFKTWSEVPLH